MSLAVVQRSGRYLRVADPAWSDPLDASFSQIRGGRWNPPECFAVLYLNRTRTTARRNVARRFAGLPYGPEDLDPGGAPLLVATDVPTTRHADIVSDAGCRAAGLPTSYPLDAAGRCIGHRVCQPIGHVAWNAGLAGVASRSAAPGAAPSDEELAWFQRGTPLAEAARWSFEDWFWDAPA